MLKPIDILAIYHLYGISNKDTMDTPDFSISSVGAIRTDEPYNVVRDWMISQFGASGMFPSGHFRWDVYERRSEDSGFGPIYRTHVEIRTWSRSDLLRIRLRFG